MNTRPCMYCGAPAADERGGPCSNASCIAGQRRKMLDPRAPLTGQVTQAQADEVARARRRSKRRAAKLARRRNRRAA